MPLRDDLLTPIPGDDPGGPDLRNSPDYVAIEEARRAAEAALHESGGTQTTEYANVIRLAGDFIATKSKDLQVAAWLTEALLRREGFGGFRSGLELIDRLLTQSWDHLHPRGEDGDFAFRAAPIGWIGASSAIDFAVKSAPLTDEGFGQIHYEEARTVPRESDEARKAERFTKVKEGKLTPEEFHDSFKKTAKGFYKELATDIEGAINSMQSLESKGAELFKDDAPQYLALRNALSAVHSTAQKLLAEKLEMDPDPVAQEVSAPSGGEVSDIQSSASVSATPASREDATSRVATAANFLRQENATDPASYLILRGLRWGELRSKGGQVDLRMLVAPTGQMRTTMRDLELAGKWDELLEAGERIMARPQGRGWLDLQRYILTACENLGPDFAAVHNAIRGALTDLLRDLPDLPVSKMMDDFPTANPDTVTWLNSNFSSSTDAMHQDASTSLSQPNGNTADPTLARAKAAVRRLGPQGGIEFLMDAAERAESARERFLRTSQAAEIMVEHSLTEVALPILNKLVERIDKKDQTLEDWESGAIVARTLSLKYKCLSSADEKKALYDRICRLDPVRAMSLRASPPPAPESGSDAPAPPPPPEKTEGPGE